MTELTINIKSVSPDENGKIRILYDANTSTGQSLEDRVVEMHPLSLGDPAVINEEVYIDAAIQLSLSEDHRATVYGGAVFQKIQSA